MERLKYLPSGHPVLEMIIACKQAQFGKASVGYYEAVLEGKEAEDLALSLKVGDKVRITGSLWARQFRNRQGKQERETRVIAETIQGE